MADRRYETPGESTRGWHMAETAQVVRSAIGDSRRATARISDGAHMGARDGRDGKRSSFGLTAARIAIDGRHFVDPAHRVLSLRGCNVGGASKVPRPCTPRLPLDRHREVSYVDRPFPLADAPDHWRRLSSWGFTFVRLNVTWEAIEHAGMGEYDRDYLDYLKLLIKSMEPFGMVCYVSIHQDVFSRLCGGSGAPGWTLELAGFDLSNDGEHLEASGAAYLGGVRGGLVRGERGLWPTGYTKLASLTMNTLFWAGRTFAPHLQVRDASGQERNIQDVLQDAFLAAIDVLVRAVGDLDAVIGFELMNEPHPGYIGLANLHEFNYNTDLHLGLFPSALQSMSMASGNPTPHVPFYTRTFPFPTSVSHLTTGNPTSASAWAPGRSCPWQREGVYTISSGRAIALQHMYFTTDRDGEPVDFYNDFYFPFVRRWDSLVRSRRTGKRDMAMMVEAVPNEFCPPWKAEDRPQGMVYAPHWYDLDALFKKQSGWMTVNVQGLSRGMFLPLALYFGKGIKKNYALQIGNLVRAARDRLGDVPVVIGECGVPMDLNGGSAFKTGDFKWQRRMMDALISALEASGVGFNLWNYNPSNSDVIGDDWCSENFSWYSDSRKHDQHGGARLLDVIVRPYAIATAGEPLSSAYDADTRSFSYSFKRTQHTVSSTTELFLPSRIYPSPADVDLRCSAGEFVYQPEDDRLFHYATAPGVVEISVGVKRKRKGTLWVTVVSALLAFVLALYLSL